MMRNTNLGTNRITTTLILIDTFLVENETMKLASIHAIEWELFRDSSSIRVRSRTTLI
jgi:hypothetical protein